MNTVRLRWMAVQLGIERIVLKNAALKAYFISNPESDYFQSPVFAGILNFLKEHPHFCTLKETNNKLMIVISNITRVADALSRMAKIVQE